MVLWVISNYDIDYSSLFLFFLNMQKYNEKERKLLMQFYKVLTAIVLTWKNYF